MRRVLRRVLSIVVGVALAVVVAVVAAVVIVPRVLGWVPLTILSGSMEPTIPVGSQVIVEPLLTEAEVSDLQLGDVITFMPNPDDPTLVTHRVVGRTLVGDGTVELTTQGDANDVADEGVLTSTQIRGLVRYHVPYVGYAATFLGPGEKNLVAAGLAVSLLAYAVWQISVARRARRNRPARHRGAPAAGNEHHDRHDAGDTEQDAHPQREGTLLRP